MDIKDYTAKQYLDLIQVMVVTMDADSEVVLINKKGCELLGYSKEEIIGKNWFDNFIPKTVREKVKKVFATIVHGESEEFDKFENTIVDKSGEERIISWHNTFIKDESGSIIGSLSSGEDITDQRKTLNNLKAFNKLAVDRELKMIELKKRIEELEKKVK